MMLGKGIKLTGTLIELVVVLLFIGFLLIQAGVYVAQHYPHKVSSWVNQYTPYTFSYKEGVLQQDWTGFQLSLKGVTLKHAHWQIENADIALDMNLLALFHPTVTLGEKLTLRHARITLPKWEGVERNSPISPEWALPQLKKMWQKVVLQDIEFQQPLRQSSLYFWIKRLESRIGALWVVQGDLGLDDQPFLINRSNNKTSKNAAIVSFSAQLQPSFLGVPEQGNVHWTTLRPFSTRLIRHLLSIQQSALLPAMKLSLDGEAYLQAGTWHKAESRFNIQQIHWPDMKQDRVLPKSLGFELAWRLEGGENIALKNVRLDQHYLKPKVFAEVKRIGRQQLTFHISAFDASPLIPILERALTVYGGVPEKAWQKKSLVLKVSPLEGRFDFQRQQLEYFQGRIQQFEFPQNSIFPEIHLQQLSVKQQANVWHITMSKPMTLAYSKAFEKPLRLKFLDAIKVETSVDSHLVRIPKFTFSLDQVLVQLQLQMQGVHQVSANLSAQADNIQQIKEILPYSLMSEKLKQWLKTALMGGEKITLHTRLSGDISQFPFKQGGGEFIAKADVHNTTLKFQPDWPALTKADVHLKFKPYDLTITAPRAEMMGVYANNIKVTIPNLNKKNIGLGLSGSVKGQANQAQALLLASPLAKKIGIEKFLREDARLSGDLQVALKSIWIPLLGYEHQKEKIRVDVQFEGVDLSLYDTLDFQDIRGALKIRDEMVESRQLVGTLTGEPFEVSLHTASKTHRLEIQGHGAWQPPKEQERLKGYIKWQHHVSIPFQKQLPLTMRTKLDLQNFHSFLPAPLDQTALNGRQMVISYQQAKKNAQIQASLPGLFSLKGEVRADKKHPISWMQIALGQQKLPILNESQQGILVKGRFTTIDIDKWLGMTSELKILFPKNASNTPKLQWQPSNIIIDHLIFKNYDYPHTDLAWQSINTQQLTLSLKNTQAQIRALKQNKKWSVQIDKLHVHTEKETATTSLQSDCYSSPQKIAIPEMSLDGKNIQWGERHFDRVSAKVHSFNKVLLIAPIRIQKGRAKGIGEYVWTLHDNKSRFHMRFSAPKVQELTAMLAIEKGLKGKKGVIETRLEWKGGPNCLGLQQMRGRVSLRLDDGVIKQVEPGIARLLGLLSIESLAKRLKLDLSDVTDEGLAYSIIEGTGRIRNGVFGIEDFKLIAPSAKAKLFGHVNLVNKTFDLRADVTPAIGSSIATIATIVGAANPVAAILTYALLKNIPEINENLITYHYKITGPWENPKIKEKGGVELIQTPN